MLENKIYALFDEDLTKNYSIEKKLCIKYFSYVGARNYDTYYSFERVRDNITEKSDVASLISHTIAFSNSAKLIGLNAIGDYILDCLIGFLNELKLNYELLEDDDGCFIIPKGAYELDEKNINIPFEWLKAYPSARTAMENALKAYSNMDNPSQVADLFRKTLETFAQEFFDKNASLENLKSVFGQFFKSKGVPQELSSNLETTLQMYTNYMNNYAKHHDKTERKYLEFIMYQTGNIIRFVISLTDQ